MAVKAKAQITISRIVDIESVTRYYLLQSSTAAAPAIPTANPPGGNWVKTEPTYTTGSTNTLYFVDLTLFTNGTYSYSAVSTSSSYEAAKAAYNKANAAADTANAAKDKIDNLQVGGRNLALDTKKMKTWTKGSKLTITYDRDDPFGGTDAIKVVNSEGTSGSAYIEKQYSTALYLEKSSYTVSFYAKTDTVGSGSVECVCRVNKSHSSYKTFALTTDWVRYTNTYSISAAFSHTEPFWFNVTGTAAVYICHIQIEKGNKATDWTEAPEDVDSKISDVDERIVGRNLIKYGKGDRKEGFFSNFPTVNDEYGEFTLKSKRTHAAIDLSKSFVIPTREYQPGDCYIWSYDIMFTQWDFTGNSNIKEWWMGQRYTNKPAGDTSTATGSWTFVTAHHLPRVGNDYALNEWYHIEQIVKIPKKASDNVGSQAVIIFYNSNGESEVTITVRLKNVKLEKGTTATPWIPALEDSTANVYNEYYQSTSQSSLSGGSWSTAAPKWEQGKYIWSRTVIVDGAGTKTYRPSQNGVCIAGAKGDPGATGNGITDSLILYAPSSDGINPPAEDNGDWTDHIEGLPDGAYLWVRVIYYYSDGTEKSVYSVSKNGDTGAKGDKGETGNGIKSTSITYQAHSSQTSVPTGTWLTQDAMPTLSADKPYLWTRVIYTYTDGTSSSPVYTVGSTLDGIQIGGTQLISLQNLTAGLLSTTGTLSTPTVAHKTSDYIPVLANEKYVASTNSDFASNGYMAVCWYNSSKTFLSCAFRSQALKGKYCNVITSPSTAAYARVSFPDANKKTVKFERGNIASDWSANPADVDARIDEVEQAASNAQNTADGKNTVFYQISKPSKSNRKINDIWFDTDDGNAMYYWSGSAWTKKEFGSSSIAAGSISTNHLVASAITTAKIAANAITTAKLATDAIKSSNYAYSSGSYSAAGTFLDLKTGLFRSKNFAIDADGNAYFRGTLSSEGTVVLPGDRGELPSYAEVSSSKITFSIKNSNNKLVKPATIECFMGLSSSGGLKISTGDDGLIINTGFVSFTIGTLQEGSGGYPTRITDCLAVDGLAFPNSGNIIVGNTLNQTIALTALSSGLIDCPVGVRGNQLLSGTDKTDWNDQNVGVCVSYDGTIHMTHASGANIGYHYAKSAATTSYIKETESGTLELSKNVNVKNALTVGADAKLSFGKQVMWGGVAGIYSSQNQRLYLHASTEANYYLYLGTDSSKWTLAPDTSGKLTLGTANKKWGQIYSTSASINTSDRNVKKDIKTLDPEQMIKFIMALDAVGYKFIDGESGRQHTGMVSQQVFEAMKVAGLTDMDFAGFIKSPEYKEVVKENGMVEDVPTGDYIYGLRYEEFIAPLISVVQNQQKQIDELKKRLN